MEPIPTVQTNIYAGNTYRRFRLATFQRRIKGSREEAKVVYLIQHIQVEIGGTYLSFKGALKIEKANA